MQHKGNYVYFTANKLKGKQKSENTLSEENFKKILEGLFKNVIKEKTPEFHEIESLLQNFLKENKSENEENSPSTENNKDEELPITKILTEAGYLRDERKWLTKKGFLEIGSKILQDVMKNLNSTEIGFHETKLSGNGNVLIDSTKKFEPGSDMRSLSTSQTLLNSIQRILKLNNKITFPISLELDDLEEYETLEDVRTSIVYCIDLSSTMKYSLGNKGKSRIEAAKQALWSLYILNNKFFPNDSIFIVGFGSMASEIKPYDIPFLKTFDANDSFLHYTNYQAAFRLAKKILKKTSAINKRIVLITDGQPSACYIDNEFQKNEILSEKPYSNFYTPNKEIISKIKSEKDMNLENYQESLVYLCYRYKKVDPKIDTITLMEAKKCLREGIDIDTIVVSEEEELLTYVKTLEKELLGKTYHINQENMDQILVYDYLSNTRKVLSPSQSI